MPAGSSASPGPARRGSRPRGRRAAPEERPSTRAPTAWPPRPGVTGTHQKGWRGPRQDRGQLADEGAGAPMLGSCCTGGGRWDAAEAHRGWSARLRVVGPAEHGGGGQAAGMPSIPFSNTMLALVGAAAPRAQMIRQEPKGGRLLETGFMRLPPHRPIIVGPGAVLALGRDVELRLRAGARRGDRDELLVHAVDGRHLLLTAAPGPLTEVVHKLRRWP
eukprot:CAMPEP_0179290570 /NCGR_PEP_ID=MMETSP0797-20121207/41885_1 /TAXON_ID=47934 /ORGANISM="Dinophysis acuminata, Strain DAEP01" /LENGTH=217 /DNA_ID=CAMNT_0020999609 /DNA_START=1 /DNA_END=653 /DNA_ORIENTATION=-